jgi:hypothetical protein
VANLTFDYTYQATDGIRIIKQESADGTRWQAGFDIFSIVAPTSPARSTQVRASSASHWPTKIRTRSW